MSGPWYSTFESLALAIAISVPNHSIKCILVVGKIQNIVTNLRISAQGNNDNMYLPDYRLTNVFLRYCLPIVSITAKQMTVTVKTLPNI